VTGLSDPQHYSSAADLATLAAALIRDYPEYYPIYSRRSSATTTSRSPTATGCCGPIPYVDGMKTGPHRRRGLVPDRVGEARRPRLLAVVLGASSDAARAAEAQKLLNWGFQAFDTVALYQSGKPVSTLACGRARPTSRRAFSPTAT
jgi:D-alanyl-D-alanine carboxypeptidase (penicillin-binding protein 5/6)